ncbi:MAG: radical SAM protein [Candidatus Hadarchaeota archaeon]
MNAEYFFITCKSVLSQSKLPGLKYSLNPYRGCEHGCIYCYVPSLMRDKELTETWGKSVWRKLNLVDVLAKEVKKKPRGIVGVSTVCDPYQPIEADDKLTRRCIQILADNGFHVSIHTKSSLVLRDADIIAPEKFDVGTTITTMDRGLAALLEPGAATPAARAKVLEEFSARGVETWLFLGPIIPFVNDSEDSLKQVIEVAARTKSKLIYDKFNVNKWALEQLKNAFETERSDLVGQLPCLVRDSSELWQSTVAKINEICRDLRVNSEAAFPTWPDRATEAC